MIVNFAGVGNGFMVIPLLQCIEHGSNLWYYHTDNVVFQSRMLMEHAKLTRLLGTIPSSWRRFCVDDWSIIHQFLREQDISVIINIRNEGPEHDTMYYEFKHTLPLDVVCWELDFALMRRRHKPLQLMHDILTVCQIYGVDSGGYTPQWLGHLRPQTLDEQRIGLFTGASQPNKRWPLERWVMLGNSLLKYSKYTIDVIAGSSSEEIAFAAAVAQGIIKEMGNTYCRLIVNRSLEDIVLVFRELTLLVSNDSFAVHAAAALNVPTVGLYLATNGLIWGGDSTYFTPVQSDVITTCKHFKPLAGNCLHYYERCEQMCSVQNSLSVTVVLQTVVQTLPSSSIALEDQ